jgi:hypothetical protein
MHNNAVLVREIQILSDGERIRRVREAFFQDFEPIRRLRMIAYPELFERGDIDSWTRKEMDRFIFYALDVSGWADYHELRRQQAEQQM